MQKISWLAFCPGDPGTQSLLHLFPASKGSGAPYATECLIELFGLGEKCEQVVLNGVRMCQPDGLRLSEIFPVLNQQKGFYGLQVTLQSDHARADLSGSDCIIELLLRPHSVRYHAQKLCDSGFEERKVALASGIALQDSYNSTSLVVINGSSEKVRWGVNRSRVQEATRSAGNSTPITPVTSADSFETIAPMSIQERKLDKTYFLQSSPREASWGMVHLETITAEPLPEECACFVMYRDSITKRPMSVCRL